MTQPEIDYAALEAQLEISRRYTHAILSSDDLAALIAKAKEADEFAILNELLKSALIKVEYDRDAARAILSRAAEALEPFADGHAIATYRRDEYFRVVRSVLGEIRALLPK